MLKLLFFVVKKWESMKSKRREIDIRELRKREIGLLCDIRIKKIDLKLVREQIQLLKHEPATERITEPEKVKRLYPSTSLEIQGNRTLANTGSRAK